MIKISSFLVWTETAAGGHSGNCNQSVNDSSSKGTTYIYIYIFIYVAAKIEY